MKFNWNNCIERIEFWLWERIEFERSVKKKKFEIFIDLENWKKKDMGGGDYLATVWFVSDANSHKLDRCQSLLQFFFLNFGLIVK